MAELLSTIIKGTLNVNDYFNIDGNGNLTLKSGNNEIFKVGNDSSLTIKKDNLNLFNISSDGLNLYVPSATNENILTANENGLTLNKGDLIITDGEIKAKTLKLFDDCNIDTEGADVNIKKPTNITGILTTSELITANGGISVKNGDFTSDVKLTVNDSITGKSLNINGSANIDLQTTDDSFSITYNKSSLLKQETDNLYIRNKNITNIDTGFLNIDVDKNLETITIYGGKGDEIGIPSTYSIETGDYIIVNGYRHKVIKVYTNPEIKLYGFLAYNISGTYYAKFPIYYYGNIETNYKILDNANSVFNPITLETIYKQIIPQVTTFIISSQTTETYIYGVNVSKADGYYITEADKIVYSSISKKNYDTLISDINNACNFTADEQTPIKKYIKSGDIIDEDQNKYNNGNPLIILTVTTSDLKLLQLDGTVGTIKSDTVIYKEVSKTSDSLGLVTVNGKVNAKELYENNNRVLTKDTAPTLFNNRLSVKIVPLNDGTGAIKTVSAEDNDITNIIDASFLFIFPPTKKKIILKKAETDSGYYGIKISFIDGEEISRSERNNFSFIRGYLTRSVEENSKVYIDCSSILNTSFSQYGISNLDFINKSTSGYTIKTYVGQFFEEDNDDYNYLFPWGSSKEHFNFTVSSLSNNNEAYITVTSDNKKVEMQINLKIESIQIYP